MDDILLVGKSKRDIPKLFTLRTSLRCLKSPGVRVRSILIPKLLRLGLH